MTMTREELNTLYKNDFLKPEIYQGDVCEAQNKYGESFYFPYGLRPQGEDYETFYTSGDRYLARLSASGFLDCTDWNMFDTEQEAIDYLASLKDD